MIAGLAWPVARCVAKSGPSHLRPRVPAGSEQQPGTSAVSHAPRVFPAAAAVEGVGGPVGAPATVSAVIVNYNGGDDLLRCVAALRRQPAVTEVIVVDNRSRDGSVERLAALDPVARVIASARNLGYAGAANLGGDTALGSTLLFLNPDVVVADGCIQDLLRVLGTKPGVAGPVVEVQATGQTEYGAVINHLGMPRALAAPGRSPLYVSGCALATSREVFAAVGGFDERYFMFMEDIEYCWRALLLGYEVSVASGARAWHRGGAVALGGYPRGSEPYRTTAFRVAYRERNTLALLITCAPTWWWPVVLPAVVLRTLGTAVVAFVLLRRPDLSWSLLQGLGWNVRELPTTLHRRRTIDRHTAPARTAGARVAFGSGMLRTMLRHGLPKLIKK
jgi:GT2 family glycosyltransferase